MLPVLFLAAVLLPAGTALAQPRAFTCIGAEQLEEDVFAIPFPKGKAAPGEAARTNLAAAAERAKREPGRMLCVLGHAGPQEGGAQSGIQLAAKRAGRSRRRWRSSGSSATGSAPRRAAPPSPRGRCRRSAA
ncbi:hypothetical protein [Dankookia sp. P2]|uniref:hypothetical protein n=1 Tax=Dankookia sp. P2 TaxID=3423955 RepID=UPI003D67E1BD